MYIHRQLEDAVLRYAEAFPVVAVLGPRQSGKSTLLQHLFSGKYRYVSFDDLRLRALFQDDPEAFIARNNDHVIIDEVQKAPEIIEYIKRMVDRDRTCYGKFILTGSSQFMMMRHISESLAGRIGLLTLLPFSYEETPSHLRETSIWRGCYPELLLRDYAYADEWYAAYIDTYLTRDIRDFANVLDLREFRRFVQLLAGNAAQLLNLSRYATELGVAVSTIKRWIGLLEQSFVIFTLPPYHAKTAKRLVKSPKIYFTDTGIISALTGIRTREMYENGPMSGALFENYVVSEVRKKYYHSGRHANLSFFRTSHGLEVDLIVEEGDRRICIEIKHSSTFRPRMFDTFKRMDKEFTENAYLVYRGETLPDSPRWKVVNYGDFIEDLIVQDFDS